MLSRPLIKLIETHAESLTRKVVQDVQTNEHTRSHARIPNEGTQFSRSRALPEPWKLDR